MSHSAESRNTPVALIGEGGGVRRAAHDRISAAALVYNIIYHGVLLTDILVVCNMCAMCPERILKNPTRGGFFFHKKIISIVQPIYLTTVLVS